MSVARPAAAVPDAIASSSSAPPDADSAGRPRWYASEGLYGYIWNTSGSSQIKLALLAIVICLLDLVPLELQRRIVNDAIHNHTFTLLLWLSAIYGGTVLLQGLSKLAMNIYRNSVGEAASRRLRLDTYDVALHHPQREESDKEGLGVSIILSEADPVGSFVATAVSEPVLHGGVLISVFTYLLFLQPWMALLALGLFVPQLIFVPAMQHAINARTEARIQTLRDLSIDVVNETANGVEERSPELYRARADDVYRLNMQIYRQKFSMNFLMNLLFHFGIVGVLFVGGWLVMQNSIEVGTVVAFISGLHKVNDPWGDLVTFFRDMTNARVKYRLIAGVLAPDLSNTTSTPAATASSSNGGDRKAAPAR